MNVVRLVSTSGVVDVHFVVGSPLACPFALALALVL